MNNRRELFIKRITTFWNYDLTLPPNQLTNPRIMTRYHVCIKGSNVQRCGFRNFASKLARELGLYGHSAYIDQQLHIEVEGMRDQLRKFIDWCKTGPDHCQIEEVEIKELPLAGYGSFKIIPGVISSKTGVGIHRA